MRRDILHFFPIISVWNPVCISKLHHTSVWTTPIWRAQKPCARLLCRARRHSIAQTCFSIAYLSWDMVRDYINDIHFEKHSFIEDVNGVITRCKCEETENVIIIQGLSKHKACVAAVNLASHRYHTIVYEAICAEADWHSIRLPQGTGRSKMKMQHMSKYKGVNSAQM